MATRTVLFIGAGIHQRRAILRARELGLRVVAADSRADAPGLAEADVAEVTDFSDLGALVELGRRHAVDGVLTVSADRAVPVVAAVAEALGLPGIGTEVAHGMTNKLAMRRRLERAGVPQPRFAAVRTRAEAQAAAGTIGFPAVLKPADSGGQRGVYRLESPEELDLRLPEALAETATGEAILERFHDGLELNGIVVARRGEAIPLTLSDRLRPPGPGFGVGWIHVYPPSLPEETVAEAERVAAAAVEALGLRDGVAFPQLLASDGEVRVVEVAARIPGGQMADLVRHAVGVDLVELELRRALGEEIPDSLLLPRFRQPLAIRFFTAEPGPLPAGRVRRVGPLAPVLAAPGVVQADTYLRVGETIRPVRLDGDRRGYVIAIGATGVEALERAEAAARLFEVEVEPAGCSFTLDHYRELLDAARAGGYRFAVFDRPPQPGDLLLRHDVDLSLEAAVELAELEAELGVRATYFLMTESVFYNLASPVGVRTLARLRELGHRVGLHAAYPNARLDERFDPVLAWHNPEPEYMTAPVEGAVNVMEARFFDPANYRSDSNQRWGAGGACPHEALAAGEFAWLQLLIHPEIWAFPGDSMRKTMLAMLERDRELKLVLLAADKIDLS